MAGHSKWANIKHKKAAQDKKRGKIFTKLIKEITVAAKIGSPDPDSNPRLRAAIQNAKKQSVPKDNIEKAVKKATSADAKDINEINYEAYGPYGVALFIEVATDNPTRSVSNIRSYLNKYGGSLGKDGCLQFVFEQKAVFEFMKGSLDEEALTLDLIDVGAEDVELENDRFIVSAPMDCFGDIQKKLEELSIETENASLERVPLNFKEIDEESFSKISKLIDLIEDDDDVQTVYHNIQFNESFIA